MAGGGGPPIVLHERFAINPAASLPDLDSPTAKAFGVDDRKDAARRLFALVCPPGIPTRLGAAAILKSRYVHGLLPLIDFGMVDWLALGQRTMVFVYERPLGGRLMDLHEPAPVAIHVRDLAQRLIEPLANTLREMASANLTHRAVRPDNIFFMDEARQQIVLGDCLTTPEGFDQPTVFETIESGLCSPAGRGRGSILNDLYSLGVTLVFALLGHNPVANLSREQILEAKILEGSYATLCGSERISLALLEPLRGLLSDDPGERWGFDQLGLWLDGRRLTPIQKKAARKAERGFFLGGREYRSMRNLANAMSRNPEAAAKVIRDGHLEMWLRRSLDEPDRAAEVAAAVQTATSHLGDAQYAEDVLVAKACIILDPEAPVRYKGFSFMPDGFGSAMAVELLRKNDLKLPVEVLMRDIPTAWFKAQIFAGVGPAASVAEERNLAIVKNYLQVPDPGYGIERCLYELNPGLPCQSPLIQQDYVVQIEDLLPALDRASKRIDTKAKPVDRHIAAFIAARFGHNVEPHLAALADPKPEKSTLGMLSLLAVVQWRTHVEAVFGLASWVGGLLGPALDLYHSRSLRREMEKEIPRLVRKGSLPELFNLIDNAEARQKDRAGFAAAVAQFATAESEVQKLEKGGTERVRDMERSAQQMTAMASVTVALIVIAVLFFSHNW